MKILKNILFWTATVCLVLAIMAVAVPKLFGVQFRAVLTGSMEPEIPTGSLVVIVPTQADDIKLGDDITFVTESNNVVTHRVIDIDRENNTFTTYGIANGSSNKDPANKYENIIGVVKLHIPNIGQAFMWLSTTTGKIITVTAIIAVFLLSFIISTVTSGTKNKKKKEDIKIQPTTPVLPPNEGENTKNSTKITQNADLKAQEEKIQKADTIKDKTDLQPKGKTQKQKPEETDDFWNGDDRT